MTTAIDFELPHHQEATAPPEARGLKRDEVRMMVAELGSRRISHTRFNRLVDHLRPGDGLIVNVSRTLAAALAATAADGRAVMVHLSAPLPGGLWTLEVRTPAGHGTLPGAALEPQTLSLEGGGYVELLARHLRSSRLWVASLDLPEDFPAYLARHGRPIRYGRAAEPWPLDYYQTVYASEPGSAEMPSAGRPFTPELLVALMAKGVTVLPLVLHCGVASFETGETPGEERYRVPVSTATLANALRSQGGRLVAVGTTVVRALETVVDQTGALHPGAGYTDLVISREHRLRSVDGLLTGWHEPGSSHLDLIEAMTGPALAARLYEEGLTAGYLWHEFGDVCLIIP
jgi:S-adenosylmethionine:tRNA ribosyltransferase-isomerase